MNILIQNIAHQAGINEDKARIALLTVSAHIKERYPLLQSVVELILEANESDFNDEPVNTEPFKRQIGLN
ncbi:MAG TPA: hypothetical protein VFP87_04070 [Chitinophagaceae bacterium]|nr:hypothetical protein [Chitinophagaceae bacterium]